MSSAKQRQSGLKRVMTLIVLCLFASPALASSQSLMHTIYWVAILTQDVSIGMGVAMILGGLFKMKRYGEMRTFMSHQMTLSKPLSYILVGGCMMALPELTKTLLLSLWGNANPLAYPGGGDISAQIMKPIIMLIRLVGVFGIIRGMVMLPRASGPDSQPGTLGKALMHLLGGLMCLHIINVYNLIKWALGFS